MVRGQLLARGVDEPRLLEAFLATPRHLFVDEALRGRAYGDAALPIGCGQTLSQPFIVARMLHLLGPGASDRVLEIGTGSGYQTALLARLAGEVYTVERLEALLRRARDNWERAEVGGIHARLGDGSLGWAAEAPFEGIVVGAAAPAVPPALLQQLVPGGRMVVPVGNAVRQVLKLLVRTPGGAEVRDFDPCSFVRLVGREGFGT
ncbi:MAG: protein-L-isoaspartate(D-aspartate) O-methyltransferase [Candidatus Polarisedimenticolia bacterium]